MNKLNLYQRLPIVLGILLALSTSALSYSGGITGRTQKNGFTKGCGSCHGSSATPGVSVTFTGPSTIQVNQTVAETLTISGGPAVGSGCDIATGAGTLAAISSDIYLSGSELTHAQSNLMTGGIISYFFHYTAPSTPQTDTLFAAGLSNNNNGSSSGDAWNWAPKKVLNITSAVPIQLSQFTARTINANDVRLEWTTVSEVNNYGFFVQRRPENDTTYQTVSPVIPGNGTTLLQHDYSWTDSNLTIGSYYYRLKQQDLDGSVTYASEIKVVVTGVTSVNLAQELPQGYSLDANYPNPFNPSTVITYQLPIASFVRVTIYDQLGREVETLADGIQTAGSKFIRWNADNASSGIYFCRLSAFSTSDQTRSFSQIRKMILVK